jgi:hypothetical protein
MNKILLTALSFIPGFSLAGFFINPAVSYYKTTESNSSAIETTRDSQHIEAYFGWRHIKGTLLGFSYGKMTLGEEQSNLTYATSKKITASGPVIGWLNPKPNGLFFTLAWYNSAELEETDVSTSEYEGGGTAINIGYKMVVKKIGFGFGITHKSFKFEEQKLPSTTITLTNPIKISDTIPSINLWITF